MVKIKGTLPEGKFLSSVKVGARGQIVIPKEAREMLDINPGDSLLLLADKENNISVMKYSHFDSFMREVLDETKKQGG